MTEIRFEELKIPAAGLHGENPLPDIKGLRQRLGEIKFSDEICEDEKEYFYYGRIKSILPYCIQDDYDRAMKTRAFKACVLENEYLRATFLPELGGRLYSLYDKENKRDLVHRNPVFQPANLALRNAWFSGGVEFNIGMTGHTPFTVSPLFTAVGTMKDGTKFLRMYEWERIRKLAYSIDAYLPEKSRFLFVRITVINDNEETVPMYWWSNIAVDETEKTRIIVPCEKAYVQYADGSFGKDPVPMLGEQDRSYPARIPYAFDQFFDIPKEERKWICALDGDGKGLVHTSTDRLLGRKLFNWGDSRGGRRWQEFLSVKGSSYCEIQAGCAHMQQQRTPMEGNSVWNWTEAYGYLEADKDIVHGDDWTKVYKCVGEELEKRLPRKNLDEIHESFSIDNVELVYEGSGWGALELKRRERGKVLHGLVFDNIGKEQEIWLRLLEENVFEEFPVNEEPAKYVTQVEWMNLLEKSTKENPKSFNWHALYHLGVMKAANEDLDGALECFQKSIDLKPNIWSYWCLGILENNVEYMDKALGMLTGMTKIDVRIVVDCLNMCNKKGLYEKALKVVYSLDESITGHPRVRLACIDSLIGVNEFDKAEKMFSEDIVPADLKEGEELLSNQWYKLHARKIMHDEGIGEEKYKEVLKRVVEEVKLPDYLDFIMQYRPLT